MQTPPTHTHSIIAASTDDGDGYLTGEEHQTPGPLSTVVGDGRLQIEPLLQPPSQGVRVTVEDLIQPQSCV